MLGQRVLSAIVLGSVLLLTLWWGGVAYLVFVAIAAFLAGVEYLELSAKMGFAAEPGLALSLIFLFLFFGAGYLSGEGMRAGLGIILVLSLAGLLWSRNPDPLLGWALALGGGLYVGWLFSNFLLLRNLPQGVGWTLLAFLPTWAHDTAAYFVGLRFGRRTLAPRVSPHKTWEGTIGGWAFATLVAMGGVVILGRPVVEGLVLGLILSMAATVGDLVESFFKRRAGAKDSGTLIPGHGGVLDRVDSLLFTVPVVYYYAHWGLGV
ncbi:MAG: phosphatidate cytidylyltransferase [Chloroflexi bacterium]|nr:phosphatidate cytidylyltransferase [Chloroflexota bacterium]